MCQPMYSKYKQRKFKKLFKALPYLMWDERPLQKDIDISELTTLMLELARILPVLHNVYMTGFYNGHRQGAEMQKDQDELMRRIETSIKEAKDGQEQEADS